MAVRVFVGYMVLLFGLVAPNIMAESSGEHVAESHQHKYQIEARLSYIDRLTSPSQINAVKSDKASLAVSNPRSLGLTKFRIGSDWHLPYQSALKVVFRPDAFIESEQSSDQPAREFDSRSGEPYRAMPEIYLLDSYLIEKKFGSSFSLEAGVLERHVFRHMAYRPALEFGLLVRMPQKFATLHGRWQNFQRSYIRAQPKPESGFAFDIFVIQGDGDRVELRRRQDDSYDEAPTAEDAIYGLAVGLARVDAGINRFGVIAGNVDNRMSQQKESEGSEQGELVYGKRNETYVQVFNDTFFDIVGRSTKASLDLRYSKEKWKGQGIHVNSRLHQSYSLTFSTEVMTSHWICYGAHLGRSKMSNDSIIKGYQFDLGYRLALSQGLRAEFTVSEEKRQDEHGKGAYINAQGEDKSKLQRFALELSYKVHGS